MHETIVKLKPRIDVYEKEIITALFALRVITEDFTGSVTIHLNQGGITDYEKLEKGMKKRIK